jgi:hypothetical protein
MCASSDTCVPVIYNTHLLVLIEECEWIFTVRGRRAAFPCPQKVDDCSMLSSYQQANPLEEKLAMQE